MTSTTSPVAVITGASRGLGRALAAALAGRGWHLIIDARDPDPLAATAAELSRTTQVTALPGDVADPAHRRALAAAVARAGRLDLLVNNASLLGPSPLPALAEHPLDALEQVYAVNALAPLAMLQLLLPPLRRTGGRLVNVSSDAAVEAYAGWGGYGSAKAALEALTAVLAVELPDLRVYAVDPGDLRTAMHQAAFPGEDISDRPQPDTVVPAFLRLVEGDLPSGRYRAADLRAAPAAVTR
ncbi:MAG TPA: SDR family NAD(P)-dependent oxidoreductase [Pilimelia sp.]|nr:SDR family NAD(P)-dependent oxidoreductase [Pilimelia sp.]